jgi:hypothetical protein
MEVSILILNVCRAAYDYGRFYIVFIVLNTIDGGLIYAFFPETKGKPACLFTKLPL